MEKKIEICIGTDRTKHIRARLSLLVVDDNGAVQAEHYHSVSIEPGADLQALRAAVETQIASTSNGIPFAPWPKIPDAEWADVEAHCSVVHKPQVIARWEAYKTDQAAKEAARRQR